MRFTWCTVPGIAFATAKSASQCASGGAGEREACEVRVRAAVALHANRPAREQVGGDREAARRARARALERGGHTRVVGRHIRRVGAKHADREAGPWKGLAPDKVLRQPELSAKRAHFVFVVVGERLDDAPLVAQPTHELCVVVVRLDHRRVRRHHRARALDQVGTQRPLRQEHVLSTDPWSA